MYFNRSISRLSFLIPILLLSVHSAVFGIVVLSGGDGDGTLHNPFVVPRTQAAIRVDGVLDDDGWSGALIMEMPYEVQPREDVPAKVRTEMLLAYDKSNLYVGFRCYDPDPASIMAHLRAHDNVGADDWIGIVLDTFNDERRSFNFIASAAGVQYEEVQTGVRTDPGWDTLWEAKTLITDWGYAVEMAIPFSSLRFQRVNGHQVWGIDAERYYPRDQQYRAGLFKRDLNDNCYHCQLIKVQGFGGVSPGRNIEINPTLTAVRTDARAHGRTGGFEKRVQDADAGVTGTWGLTPNMTLSATANPDFSQVEADALQLDINQPFALFFEEKRPFFTEGSEFFRTSFNAVYTRTIRDPVWGFKLTGKEGPNTIGVYAVKDRLTNLIFPGNQYSTSTSLEMSSIAPVLRFKRDFSNRCTLGALGTLREGEDYHNRVVGFDFDFRLTPKDSATFQFLRSNTRYPDDVAVSFGQSNGSFSGQAMDLEYVRSTRNTSLNLEYIDIADGFRADLGFMPRVGIREFAGSSEYRWYAKTGEWWSRISTGGGYEYAEAQSGTPLERNFFYYANCTAAMRSFMGLSGSMRKERYNGVDFHLKSHVANGSFWPTGDTNLGFFLETGDDIDFANTRPARVLNVAPRITQSLGSHLRLTVSHVFERMKVEQERLYTANISNLVATWQFNTRASFRSIVQNVNYGYNPSNYTFPIGDRLRRVFSQHLFSYELNPRTVLFAGYSDNYDGNQESSLEQTDRTFFVKLGYAWVL